VLVDNAVGAGESKTDEQELIPKECLTKSPTSNTSASALLEILKYGSCNTLS
jgi:hypothetical protein